MKKTIFYFYDALCGWCYGFSPVMLEFYHKYKDEYAFEVFSGGMVTGLKEGEIGKVAGYIKHAYHDVENYTGVKFGKPFLNNILEEGSTWFSSVKPAVALSIVKEQHPEKAIEFASALQKAVYYDGIEPEKPESYLPYVEPLGFDRQDFLQKMQSPYYQTLANNDFELTKKFGIEGFPTVIFQFIDKYYLVARGYLTSSRLEENFQKTLQAAINP
jgi:putative protein-disulfide isomerase